MNNLTFSSHYARAVLQGYRAQGGDVEALLRCCDIPNDLIVQPKARLRTEQFIRLFRRVWHRLDDEFMGLTSKPCRIGHFHLMASLVVHSQNLEEVIRQTVRCYGLFSDDIDLRLRIDAGEVELSLTHRHPGLDPDHFLVEWLLMVWHRLIGWLIGRKIVLARATFTHPLPAHFDEYRFIYPCTCQFEQPNNSIFFSTRYLSMPVMRTSKEVDQFIRRAPRDLLIWTDEDNSHSSHVRHLLESFEQGGLPNLDWVSEQLHTTSYTLSRKLKAEGTSYQAIKDNLRRDQAIMMLTRQNLSIGDISSQLGFAEPGAFSRAFKHWTGVSPLAYRKIEK
ncbi:MAG: AraC family transcriptional regulator [Oceanospirillaceae bacterium]|nr:AraC family transcriptional regulator [Oceanospirillaceae bacterium]